MSPVLPLHVSDINQLQIGFVDQRGGLQRVTRTLSPHVTAGQTSQLCIHERNQLIKRALVAIVPRHQELRDFSWLFLRQHFGVPTAMDATRGGDGNNDRSRSPQKFPCGITVCAPGFTL
jgi:hypothetical protein